MLRASFRDSFTLDRTGFLPGHALRRSVVLWLFLIASIVWKRPELGIFPIVGAFVVGFGSIRALGLSRATPMFACSLGIAGATFAGSLAGNEATLLFVSLAAAGLAFGFLSEVGPGTAWVSLNCLVFFLVLGIPFPAAPPAALRNALLVLAGALAQSLTLTLFYYVRRRYRLEHPGTWFASRGDMLAATKRALRSMFRGPATRAEALAYGLRMAAALELGELAGNAFHFQRTAWVLMTSALVLKPDLRQTLTRGLGRCAGTLLGGLFATVLAAWWQPSHVTLSVLLILSATCAYLFFYANYALSTVFVTAYVVFLLAFAGLPGPEVAVLRVFATLLGGAIALLVYVPWRKTGLRT